MVRLYVAEGLSLREIARAVGCSYGKVHKIVTEAKVEKRPRGGRSDADFAPHQYARQKLPADHAAQGILPRSKSDWRPELAREPAIRHAVVKWYVEDGLSMNRIAAMLFCRSRVVTKILEDEGVWEERRTLSRGSRWRYGQSNDPAVRRKVVRLYTKRSKTTEEIAAEFGCHVGTIDRILVEEHVQKRRSGPRGRSPRRTSADVAPAKLNSGRPQRGRKTSRPPQQSARSRSTS